MVRMLGVCCRGMFDWDCVDGLNDVYVSVEVE